MLAGFFEGVDDMDRKAEELPYHLEQLLDNNRLIRCLLEWPVFDRLYSEDFSIDLLGSWQKAGGYAVAAAMYKESLTVLKQSSMTLVAFCDQQEKVAMFLIQAGQYTEAYSILESRVTHELNDLGSRADELADVYQLMAKCKSEVVKNHNFVTMDQLEEDREVVEMCRKSAEYRKQLFGDEHEVNVWSFFIQNRHKAKSLPFQVTIFKQDTVARWNCNELISSKATASSNTTSSNGISRRISSLCDRVTNRIDILGENFGKQRKWYDEYVQITNSN